MNKRIVIAKLNKIANELDSDGMFNEANQITNIMMKLAQFTPPATTPAAPVAPPFGSPVVPAVPVAPAAPAAPVTTTTKPPFATSAGAQGTPSSEKEANNDLENELYTNAITEINNYFSRKTPESRDMGEKVYENTVTKFNNLQKRQKFMNQVQRLRSKYFAAKYNQGPK